MKCNVLFIYLTPYRKTGLPIGVGSLCSVLKERGHSVKIFDTAFYNLKHTDYADRIRFERKMSKEVVDESDFFIEKNDFYSDLDEVVKSYNPDVICFSLIESFFSIVVDIADYIKDRYDDILIVAGGVLATVSPELVINEKSIDMVCVGEGEGPLCDLCDRLSENKEIDDIGGFWIKNKDNIRRNKPINLVDLDSLPHPCFDEFEEKMFYKPMQGKLYKMVNISTDRGCPFQCSFCAAPMLKKIFKRHNCGKYYRRYNIDRVIEQIYFQIEKYDPEFIYFSSELFLGTSEKDFNKFIEEYDKIRLPFWFQTRFETITKGRMSKLKKVGMSWLTIGLEHGNEKFRQKILKRKYSNEFVIEKAQILVDCGIGVSINNIMGFPFETRELIFDTIRLNKKLWDSNHDIECNIFLFTPYRGCQLRKICVDNNLIDESLIVGGTQIGDDTILNFDESFKKDLKGLLKTFNLYVKLSKEYYSQIRVAEQNDEEGAKMFKKLANLL